jgi:xanthine dehydrogenase accessory factor
MKRDILARLAAARAAKIPCAVVTDLASGVDAYVDADAVDGALALPCDVLGEVRGRIARDRSGLVAVTPGERRFVRVYAPPVRLIVVGAVHIAQALAPMAVLAGFAVTVIDPREGFVRSGNLAGIAAITAWPDEAMADIEPDMRSAVVTLTHDPKLDDPALAAALRSPAFYIGALGSRKTHARRLERLAEAGFTAEEMARIHGPVGIDIDALTPAEIAVSILAQVIQVLRSEPA